MHIDIIENIVKSFGFKYEIKVTCYNWKQFKIFDSDKTIAFFRTKYDLLYNSKYYIGSNKKLLLFKNKIRIYNNFGLMLPNNIIEDIIEESRITVKQKYDEKVKWRIDNPRPVDKKSRPKLVYGEPDKYVFEIIRVRLANKRK